MKSNRILALFLIFLIPFSLYGQTIAEKKAALTNGDSDLSKENQQSLNQVNVQLFEHQDELKELYSQAQYLYKNKADPAAFQKLLSEINSNKKEIIRIEEQWKKELSTSTEQDNYALWHQPKTTLEELIIQYGSHEYVYLIPEDLSRRELSINSDLPIPRASWKELLELILTQNGIGVKQLNPYLRQLYVLRSNLSAIEEVTHDREVLQMYPPEARLAFVLRPPGADVRRIYHFIEKFIDPQTSAVQLHGREIFFIADVRTIQEVLKLYDFASAGQGGKDYKFVALRKIQAEEMAKILNSISNKGNVQKETRNSLDQLRKNVTDAKSASGSNAVTDTGLQVITLSHMTHALFLLGTQDELQKAEEIIEDVENQLSDVREKTVFWYVSKHTNPEDLAQVLSKIYALMTKDKISGDDGINPQKEEIKYEPTVKDGVPFFAKDMTVPNPAVGRLETTEARENNENRHNFIVDLKTGAIVMVVETDILPKLQGLLKRLDVPKRMVQIDVLLFEKETTDSNESGVNLLKIGDTANQSHKTIYAFNDTANEGGVSGILSFVMSRMKTANLPAYDIAYKFLMTQKDVVVNSAPSVTTVNQTPAYIAIQTEKSINVGKTERDTTTTTEPKDVFARNKYGIKMKITPTIHMGEDECGCYGGYETITLETDITFETIAASANDRPDVTVRNVKNEVRVPNGETVILGGLKSHNQNDVKNAIPFLGEIPGIGKLFSNTTLVDETKEMFIFITPKIIEDNSEMIERMRRDDLCRRPGDTPEFLDCLIEAQEANRRHLFEGGMKILLGREGIGL